LLILIAKLPTGSIEYSNVLESEGTIRTYFVKKRGVYLWTNKTNGHQYVGSAMNLSSRLSDYFMDSYLKYQSSRGSAISAAILKYGLSEFTLQILVLGPSPDRESISATSDFIQLEQYYLDRYSLDYNIRRIAIGPAPTANLDYNKGNTNPQFGRTGSKGAA
jgi:group I intron endonuclease